MRVLTLAATLLIACTSLLAQTSPTGAYVYVGQFPGGGIPHSGKIFAFSVQQDGTVHAVSGSPFTGPAGIGAIGTMVVRSGQLFATDGVNIATYTRSSNGALRLATKLNGTAHNLTPAPDSFSFAMTLDRTNTFLYAGQLNFEGSSNNAYATFGVGSGGSLTFKSNSAIDVNAGNQIEFSGNNQYAYGQGCYFASWEVFGLAKAANGSLTFFDPGFQYPTSSDPSSVYCPVSMSANGHGYLANAFLLNAPGSHLQISMHKILASGKLSLVTNSQITTGFTGGTIRFDPTGNYLAVAGQGIAIYQLTSTKTLKKIGSTLDTTVAFQDVRWDSHGHLYAISNTALYVFTLNAGKFTATGSAHSIGTTGTLDLAVLSVN